MKYTIKSLSNYLCGKDIKLYLKVAQYKYSFVDRYYDIFNTTEDLIILICVATQLILYKN